MRRFSVSCLTLAMFGGLVLATAARAEDRSAKKILEEIKAVQTPTFDPAQRNDRAAIQKFLAARQEAMAKRAELIGELYKKDPKNAELATLLPERWNGLAMTGKTDDVKKEIDDILAHSENASLKKDALFFKAALAMRGGETDEALKAAEAFAKSAPKDERGAILLYQIGNQMEDSKKQTELFKRVAHDYPDSRVAKMVEGSLKKLEAVGRPFDLEFTDAIKGTTVSMKSLKGKVVVVDFWATWCGPCVAEMPNMKKLYAEFKPKGVEFIGVSLDSPKEEGGLDKLKKFVAENEIGWPQYYQGNGWESDFSKGWGINSIPAVFVVDADGKLYSIEARGKLDKMIPELLKKAKTSAGAGAGGQD